MELAFKLAQINLYKTAENPSVGCVVTDFNNKILSTGFTSVSGRPHAEKNALSKVQINERKRIFITLEPCSHYGKTPPCVKNIKEKKVNEVYFSHYDKNLIVYKKGFNFLKKNKIRTSIEKTNFKDFYDKYNFALKHQAPYVSAKLAITKNLNTSVPDKKYFTNIKSLKFSHLLRYFNDSILIGKNTFLKDFPKLNCRIEGFNNFSPKIFVINNNLDFYPKHLSLYSKKIYIIHSCENFTKVKKLKKYFNLIKLKSRNKIICPNDILKCIFKLGLKRLLIEGGVKTLEIFQKQNLVNKFYFIKSQKNVKKSHQSAKFLINSAFNKNLNKYRVDINLDDNELFIN